MTFKLLQQWNRRRVDERREQRSTARFQRKAEEFARLYPKLPMGPQHGAALRFSHTGHVGDVLYALPAAQALAGGAPFDLFLKANVNSGASYAHPSGEARLSEAMVERLLPLMRAQPCIRHAARHDGEPIDVELDAFRHSPLNTERGNIARWYSAVFAVSLDLAQPWLSVEPQPGLEDTVVLARSARYRNAVIDHRFLNDLPRLAFVGIEPEFDEMRRTLPDLRWIPTRDFLELARVIRGCRLFIGNQSAPFAIAEGLKVPRILEVCDRLPNVIPEGRGGYEAWMQPQFEFLVRRCLGDQGRAGAAR